MVRLLYHKRVLPDEEICGGDSDGQPTKMMQRIFQIKQMKTSNKPVLLVFTVRFIVPNPLSAMMVILEQLFEVVTHTKPFLVSHSVWFVCLSHKITLYVIVLLLAQLRACKVSIRVETE